MTDTLTERINDISALGRTIQTVDSLNALGWEIRVNDLKNSYKSSKLSEDIALELDYKKGLAHSYKIQGYCLWRFSNYSGSMEKSTKGLTIIRKIEDKKAEADILNNIGAIYMFLKDHKNRLKCNFECLRIREQIKDLEEISASLNNIGETYMAMNKIEKARNYFNKCLEYPHSSKEIRGWAYHNLGLLEMNEGNYSKSNSYLNSSIKETENNSITLLICTNHYQLAVNCLKQSDLNEALKKLDISMKMASNLGAKEEIKNINKIYAEIFERLNEFEKAHFYFKEYSKLHEKIHNEENKNILNNFKAQFEIEALQKEAKLERIKNIQLKKALKEVDKQKYIVEEKNKSINDSIKYAKRIQKAILENEYELDKTELEYFQIFMPKDIVSGDFYWSKLVGSHFYLAVVDCTGHGVPGAFMSMLGVAFLNEITSAELLPTTNGILNILRNKVIKVLDQKGDRDESLDGMDMSIIRLDLETLEMQYSGAMNSIYILRNNDIIKVKADKMGIGYSLKMKPFDLEFVDLEIKDQVVMFTDGFVDQFGGLENGKIGYSNFESWLLQAKKLNMSKQKSFLENNFLNWKSNNAQIDDVTVVSIKI